MMRCPYCNGQMDENRTFPPLLSPRRKQVLDYIAAAGVKGVTRQALKRDMFPKNSEVSMRTTIFQINKRIAPNKIVCRGSKARLEHPYWSK